MSSTSSAERPSINKRLKRWPGWVVLLGVVVVALLIAATRSGGPQTDDDRVDSISQRIACPICDGESVYESQSPAAANIRVEVKSLVQAGTYSDEQVIQFVLDNYGASIQLVPKASGFDAVVWALPVFASVCAVAGLTVAFRRWKMVADTKPTEADRQLVDEAMREHPDGD